MDTAPASVRDEVRRLVAWAGHTESGDRAELEWEPSVAAWAAVSVGWDECPGALRCPMGDECLAEAARARGEAADVVVVNTHLYGMHLAMHGTLLPEHEVVVIDEAHQLEEVVSATSGISLAPSRFRFLAHAIRSVIVDPELVASLDDMAERWAEAISAHLGERLPATLPEDLADALALARGRIERASAAVSTVPSEAPESVQTRKARAQKAILAVFEAVDIVANVPATSVAWVEGTPESPRLEVAPIDVREVLDQELWPEHTVVLTSATLPRTLPVRLGAPNDTEVTDVGSPFDYEEHALLYCAAHVPDPRRPGYEAALHDDLAALIEAAEGRTLALFTSWRAMQSAALELRSRVGYTILAQGEYPKPRLLSRFTDEHSACLFATMGFWQGIDVPGPSLSLVTIDRLPFPRPDDPLLQAAPRPRRRTSLQRDRPASRRGFARPGHRTAHSHCHRPRRRRGVRLPARDRRVPLGSRPRTAADATHTTSQRSRSVPPPRCAELVAVPSPDATLRLGDGHARRAGLGRGSVRRRRLGVERPDDRGSDDRDNGRGHHRAAHGARAAVLREGRSHLRGGAR